MKFKVGQKYGREELSKLLAPNELDTFGKSKMDCPLLDGYFSSLVNFDKEGKLKDFIMRLQWDKDKQYATIIGLKRFKRDINVLSKIDTSEYNED